MNNKRPTKSPRAFRASLLATALVLLVGGNLGAAERGLSCSPADLNGAFATLPQGVILGGPLAGHFVGVGLLTFDGKSKWTGTASSSFNGGIIPVFTVAGDFTVTSDCFISIHDTVLDIRFEGYFTKDKKEAMFVESDNGTVTTNVLHRLPPTSCRTRDLSGEWEIQATGTVVGAGQYAQIGRLTFDGNGSFSGKTGSSTAGSFVRHDVTGTYVMNADCTFAATFFEETHTQRDIFGVMYDSNEFYFDYRGTGNVIGGTGKASVGSPSQGNNQ